MPAHGLRNSAWVVVVSVLCGGSAGVAKLKQLKTLEARKAARACTTAAKKFRGEELRRRILAGAVLLDGALTREEDRELFGLGEK
jgi:hypothetical protein